MKKKIRKLIGQALLYSTLYLSSIVFTVWAFCQNTIY